MELMIGILIAFLSATTGGYAGFHFGRIRDDRLRTVDFALRILSEEFSVKRIRFFSRLKKLTEKDLITVANPEIEEFETFRRDCIEIFNTYELMCLLKVKGDLDTRIFEEQIMPIVATDYEQVDPFFAALEQVHPSMSRPFYKNVATICPRNHNISNKGAPIQG